MSRFVYRRLFAFQIRMRSALEILLAFFFMLHTSMVCVCVSVLGVANISAIQRNRPKGIPSSPCLHWGFFPSFLFFFVVNLTFSSPKRIRNGRFGGAERGRGDASVGEIAGGGKWETIKAIFV